MLKRWWTVRDDQGITMPSRLGLALASTHHDVAGSLLPAEQFESPLHLSNVTALVGETKLLGHRVYELRGPGRFGGTDILWIDIETLLVRRVTNTFGDTWFVPFVGEQAEDCLDASWWEFDPSEQADTPLERFGGKLQALLAEIDIPIEEERFEMEMERIQREYRERGSP